MKKELNKKQEKFLDSLINRFKEIKENKSYSVEDAVILKAVTNEMKKDGSKDNNDLESIIKNGEPVNIAGKKFYVTSTERNVGIGHNEITLTMVGS